MPQNYGSSSGRYGLQSNNDAIVGDFIADRQAINLFKATGNNFIDGVLSGYAWRGGNLTYAFPDSKNDYGYGPEKNNGFDPVGKKIQAAVEFVLDTSYGNHANDGFALEGFTKMKVSEGSDANSTLRYAESTSANPTAYGYYPNSGASGGDVWFGTAFNGVANGYENAVQGNYQFATVIHETGHALGLKHGHETFTNNANHQTYAKLAEKYDSLEYSVMTYNSYRGDDANGYSNEKWGLPQTYMIADIAALQHMYGANYSVNSGSTHYSWKPGGGETYVNGKVGIDPGGNRIFATIWDGGGKHDSYDLSAYSNNVLINLAPGGYSKFKEGQVADLGYYDGAGLHKASGNIYNALMYKGNTNSLIEDAIGGSGNDQLYGNKVGNHLEGNGGNDKFFGGAGNDIYDGGRGADIFYFKPNWDRDRIVDFQGNDRINLSAFNLTSFDDAMSHAARDGKDVVFSFGGGDSLRVDGMKLGGFHADDFML
jgi:serralysin